MAEIAQLQSADERSLNEINALLAELSLSPEKRKCSLELLRSIVGNETSELWTAQEEEGSIVGMATLALVLKPGGVTARVEDVVVLSSMRGKGYGRLLMQKLIERARARGATMLQLNSRPSREAANALYKKVGFELHETNTYNLKL